LFTLDTLVVDMILSPFALLGVWVGVKAHYLISEEIFFFFYIYSSHNNWCQVNLGRTNIINLIPIRN